MPTKRAHNVYNSSTPLFTSSRAASQGRSTLQKGVRAHAASLTPRAHAPPRAWAVRASASPVAPLPSRPSPARRPMGLFAAAATTLNWNMPHGNSRNAEAPCMAPGREDVAGRALHADVSRPSQHARTTLARACAGHVELHTQWATCHQDASCSNDGASLACPLSRISPPGTPRRPPGPVGLCRLRRVRRGDVGPARTGQLASWPALKMKQLLSL